MDIGKILSHLKNCDLFSQLEDGELIGIAKISHPMVIEKNQVIISQDEVGDCAYLIIEGVGKIYRLTQNGKEVPLGTVSTNQIVGEMALIDDLPRSAYVESITTISVLRIQKIDFQKLILANPAIALKLLRTLSMRIRAQDEKFLTMYDSDLPTRTMSHLMMLAKAYKSDVIPLTHEQLASLVGVTRPRLTEALHSLELQNIVKLVNHSIEII